MFVTFSSVSLLVDFLLVVNLFLLITVLLTSATCVFVVNVQGITRLELMVLINLRRAK